MNTCCRTPLSVSLAFSHTANELNQKLPFLLPSKKEVIHRLLNRI